MDERPWQMFLLNPHGLTRDEGDRLLERAGFASRLSMDATESEAKAAAIEVLEKLKQVDDTEWAACYVQPFTGGVGRRPSELYPRIRVILSGELDNQPHSYGTGGE